MSRVVNVTGTAFEYCLWQGSTDDLQVCGVEVVDHIPYYEGDGWSSPPQYEEFEFVVVYPDETTEYVDINHNLYKDLVKELKRYVDITY